MEGREEGILKGREGGNGGGHEREKTDTSRTISKADPPSIYKIYIKDLY